MKNRIELDPARFSKAKNKSLDYIILQGHIRSEDVNLYSDDHEPMKISCKGCETKVISELTSSEVQRGGFEDLLHMLDVFNITDPHYIENYLVTVIKIRHLQ